jgi:hypothetical protein
VSSLDLARVNVALDAVSSRYLGHPGQRPCQVASGPQCPSVGLGVIALDMSDGLRVGIVGRGDVQLDVAHCIASPLGTVN